MDKVRLGIIGFGAMGKPVAKWLIDEKQSPEINVTAKIQKSSSSTMQKQ